jgi:hypothetical protein
VVGPWTIWWRRNFFADVLPWLQPVMASPLTRTAVVLTGLVTMLAGLNEFRHLILHRLARGAAAADPPAQRP